MEIDEEHVNTLLSMGFPSDIEVRKALRFAKNDLNDAVAYLTNDHSTSSYDTLDDIEMKDLHPRSSQAPVYGPSPPPSYDECVIPERTDGQSENGSGGEGMIEELNPLEFPVTNLYELEGRVFAEQWSIPYKKEESLGKCLLAATRLAEANMAENDEHCRRFLERCMPESFQKLMTYSAVHRWNVEIQEGIFNMLQLFIDLVATRLQYLPVPIGLLDVLQTALNKDTEYHFKNRSRKDRTYWDDKLEGGQLFTTNTGYKSAQDTYGWLSHLINRFAMKKGLEHVKNLLENEEMDAPSMAALLRPFGTCAEFLNPGSVSEILAPGMERSIKYVQNLEEKDFKEKKVGYVSDLLASMKLLCIQMWPQHTDSLDDLRLDIALRMLKSPHFNAKMNSLKEVSKLIEEAASSKVPKTAIPSRKISDWLVEHKVLSIALEGNIDQTQYCDKIKGIVDYIGAELSQDELTMIWKMQLRQTNNVTDNIHSIIAAAAVKFDHNLLDHLFCLIHMKWQEDNDKMREKLLSLIGKIGRDARDVKSTTRVLELLWDLSHLRAMSTHLIEQALEEHLAILSDSFSVKEQEKRKYVVKCVEDIKKGACVLPALKQLLHICKNILKQSIQKSDKGILHELNKNHDVIKLVTNSLVKCHKLAITSAGDGQLSQHTIVDGRYMHSEYVTNHLSFLQYMLQEGALYLPWSRARDIWGTLIGSSDACDWDRETCYDWFSHGLTDLEMETQSQLFQKELLKLDPAKLSEKGFTCFKSFFENVNKFEHRLKSDGNKLVVEKSELLGLDYIWEICLNTPDESIASQAISLLLSVLYTHLTARLKKDPVVLHKKFITDCKSRLEAAMIGIGGTVIAQSISWATKTLTAAIVPEVANVPLPSRNKKLMNIERLMWIAEEYVLNVEETHHTARTILPHGASFHGHQMNLTVTSESPKQEFLLVCHSNETLGSIRSKISSKLRQTPENIQVVAQDKMLGISDDQKLLNQLDIEDNQVIQVRPTTSSALQSSQVKEPPATPTSKQTFDLEQEKMLPGVVMAMGGQVFEMLYQLADLEEPRITSRVRKLLMLIPTDPAISESLDSISNKMSKQMGSGDDISPRASPRKTTATVTPVSSPRLPPKEVLKVLFDSGAQDMSAFRVLYNLEVLSSKLMPTTCDIGTRLSAQQFCEDFLNCDGLQMVVNVLQPESLAPDLNYTTRQGCYSICLQLARFLLCGQTVTGEAVSSEGVASLPSEAGDMPKVTLSATPPTSLTSPLTINVERAVTAAGHAVQTMGVHVFTETVSCFMRVTWAAAAGRLHLLSSPQPIIENSNMYGCGCRSRQSSTGSTASTGSDSDCQTLHAGVCVRQTFISSKDCNIAKEALEILVACLQLRSELLASFYTLPCVSDFIIDILVGCSQSDIRNAALDQFYLLSQTQLSIIEGSTINSSVGHQTPHQFILKVLLKAYLPFWVSSASTRGASQRLLMQCSQYFDLRCRLLENLTVEDQKKLSLDVPTMLEDEINWLGNFVPSTNLDLSDTDNSLLAGHLKLIKTLFTCEGIDKEEFGRGLVYDLLNDFLFPASKVMMDSMDDSNLKGDLTEANPKCSNSESRVAAYQLLAELATDSLPILSDICKQLIQMHHLPQPDCANEWEYLPPVDGRARCGYVGLKNGGATCYMNSVIQQLYMAPGIPESVLGIDDDNIEEESVFYQIQQVFGHLMESKLQYHEPEKFWKVFQLWGQSINIREQQDAFDFFQALVDQVDEHMKKSGKEELFKARFEGIFSDQKICKDCPHRYEREESFFALNLTVKNATLQDSLDQFVHGELLEGDNAYFCEKCGEKRNTIKRMCIKTLPPLLCIQLKRFGYDWEANRALKFDDYFKFPWVLDMEPYTAEGMARREEATENAESSSESESGDTTSSLDERMPEIVESSHVESKQINYELVGVVVHSGQANAGHYYSFIKDRRGTVMDNPNKGKWYKFNDTVVEECEMTDETLEAECFGGTYKAKVYESSSSYPDDRVRYWNGYMLFYEKVQEPKNPSSAKKTKIIKRVVPDLGKGRLDSDSLMELTELVHKGERRGIFTEQMPASIHQVIQGENLTFVKNRDVYNVEYFRFVKNLVDLYSKSRNKKDFTAISVQSLQLGMKYLFNTFFRTKKRTKTDLYEWAETIECKLQGCKEACIWMVEYMSGVEGSSYIKPFLLECPNREVRFTFARILDALMSSYFKHGGIQSLSPPQRRMTQKNFDEILEHLLQMLNKDVIDHCKYCTQYFQVLFHYVQMGTKACTHMFLRRGFPRLVTFLLGQSQQHLEDQESSTRRWSSIQSREFGNLHSTLAILILNCDVSHYRTEDIGDYKPYKPQSDVHPSKLLKMSPEMEKYVFGAESVRYLREVVQAVREISNMSHHVSDMIVYCSFCNKTFSDTVLKQLMLQYTNGPSNELKMIFSLLMELLSLEDPVQLARLELIIEGTIDDSGTQYEGLIGVIRQNHLLDSRRSYSCIKFLVSLANRCSAAKNYLMQIPPKWQWAVNWLKKKMSEYYWNTPTSSTVSNEDSNRKSFQRTISAQSTLDDANALLMELETHEGTGSALDMDTNGNKSDMETETSGRTTTAPTDTQTDTSSKSTAPTDAQTDTSVKMTAPTDTQTDTYMSTEEEDKKPNS